MRKLFLMTVLLTAVQVFAGQRSPVFSEGSWYQFSTELSSPSQEVIKLTYENLTNSGISMGNVNPDKLKLFMMPPGLMSETVNYEELNPLKEIPVKLYGCEDGSFDEGDFLLFYPASQQQWQFDDEEGLYKGKFHPYSEKVNYFLQTEAEEDGLRVADVPFLDETPDVVIQNTEVLLGGPGFGGINPENAGAEFVQQEITEQPFDYEVTSPALSWPDATVMFRVVANNTDPLTINLLKNGSVTDNFELTVTDPGVYRQHTFSVNELAVSTGDVFTVECPDESNFRVFLDDLTLTGAEEIAPSGLFFNSAQSNEEVVEWNGPWSSEVEVWNVTSPESVVNQIMNEEYAFRTQSEVKQKFAAFNPQTGEGIQEYSGNIEPIDFTNLFTMSTPDVFVITNQHLMEEAQNYASFHQSNGFTVEVVDIADVFSKFSGGVIDFTAIRNFMAHHYQKMEGALSYLTLYGDASIYSDDDRFVVPTYQSSDVWVSYMLEGGDRYFGYLDDGEDFSESDSDMDIAVGRIPVATREEAAMFNQKLIDYHQDMGDFQISMSLAADDEDNGVHMGMQEETFAFVDEYARGMNIHKIYLDQYPQEMQGEQQVSPQAQQALADAFERGDIILDFMGHGDHSAWAREQMLTLDVVNGLENAHHPFVLFPSQQNFYHPESASLAEQLLIQQNGAIASLSATEASFGQTWNNFKTAFYQAVFEEGIISHGMAMKYAYNLGLGTSVGSYCLLGDPLMSFPFPEYEIVTETINDAEIESVDTLFINEPYTVEASVYDENGVLTSFNGTARVQVFAPVHQQTTLGTDSEPFTYLVSDSLIADQYVEVTNGVFEATFSLPADYDFTPGDIKLSYFADNENYSTAGYENLFTVSQASGVDEMEGIRFKVYPTITNSDVIIEVGRVNENTYLEILNLQGNCLHRQQVGDTGTSRINLSLAGYAPGMYIVRLLGRDWMKMKKIIRK